MLTIGQLAAYAGVTPRAVRHYHQIGLLPEPERDASGYRRYGATAAVALIKIRTLADAGVPLAEIRALVDADEATFGAAIRRLDDRLRVEIGRLETSRAQIALLAAGDGLALPPEVAGYLDRLRAIGVSERMVDMERDGWVLVAARWPDRVVEWVPGKHAQLEDPRVVRLYGLLSRIVDDESADGAVLEEAADIMSDLAEEAYLAGDQLSGDVTADDVPFDLLDALTLESDPRAHRLTRLMRDRGWADWRRLERVPGRAGELPMP